MRVSEAVGMRRVLPRRDSGDFWDRMVGRCIWFTAGALSVLMWLDIGI
jgi:hypothetical protein